MCLLTRLSQRSFCERANSGPSKITVSSTFCGYDAPCPSEVINQTSSSRHQSVRIGSVFSTLTRKRSEQVLVLTNSLHKPEVNPSRSLYSLGGTPSHTTRR